ncbi:hypothetical protein KKJ17_16760 [Xenorhabdus bovienii]|uniref:hypothetical protein n=1 Tax=Xenorhabdus bovienii TaxID=40576 RepID=UPI0023B32066|nr:hypothetical protein [Xenorhabdus bovienii]MDE9519336.1 hypothetical protein [Xenorhabdus bovienii]
MTQHKVLETVYIDNNDGIFLKYEILGEHERDIHFAMAFIEVKVISDGVSYSVWSKVDNIELDHLDPPRGGGFQREVRAELYPGKSIGTAIGECRNHRAAWRN